MIPTLQTSHYLWRLWSLWNRDHMHVYVFWPMACSPPAITNRESGRKRERESEAGKVISSIVQPGHLTLLLIVCSNKGGRQRWCCSIDRLVMGAMKGPRCRWMGQLECSCKMTVLRERQQRLVRKHTRMFSHISDMHEYTLTPTSVNFCNQARVGW